MRKTKLLFKLLVLVACIMCSMSAVAAEAYACYTPDNTTLTFYYDNYRSSRTGTTYDLNTGSNSPGWVSDDTNWSVTRVVFNSSFANARPISTYAWFNYMTKLDSITGMQNLNTSEVTTMGKMFQTCRNLTSLDLSHFNTAKVTDMSYMFSGSNGLMSLDVSSFNTAKVTNMGGMFSFCSGLTSLDVSSFNTAKVTDMSYMFYNCRGLTTIYAGDAWSTAAVTSSSNMFNNCTSLVGGMGTAYDANHVDKAYAHIDGGTSNPGYLSSPPEAYACYTSSNTTLTFYYDNYRSSRTGTTYDLNTGDNYPGWDTGNTYSPVTQVVFDQSFADVRPTTTYRWFSLMNKLQSITGMSNLNTSEVTNMAYMFNRCSKLTSLDVNHFNTEKVTNMMQMFSGCSGLTSLDLSNFNTANVTNMAYMFDDCVAMKSLDLSSFNTAKVTSMEDMFYDCRGLTSLDLSGFNTSNVTDMSYMFELCTNLMTIFAGDGWSTAGVTNSNYMFLYCNSLVGGMGTTYSSSHINAAYAHIDGGPSNPGYFSKKKEAYACYTPENTTLTFYYDSQRASRPGTTYHLNTSIYSPDWDSDGTNSSVTQVVFDSSFADARPHTTYMWFGGMNNLQSIIDMEYLNTSNVTTMSHMFYDCSSLKSVDLSSFNTANVTDMDYMFLYCYGLTSLDLSSFNTSKADFITGMFQACSGLTTIYAGEGWSTAAVTHSQYMFSGCTSLVGGMGTVYDANYTDKTYAHIDGGPSNPGYFSEKLDYLRGDVNGNGVVNIGDVTDLIDLLLGNGGNSNPAADCNMDHAVNIADVTTLIDYLLNGHW